MFTSTSGGYDFEPGLPFLSFGVQAQPGHRLHRAVLESGPASGRAVAFAIEHLARLGLPAQALCGMEFRQFSERQLTHPEFGVFNQHHVAQLEAAGLLVDGKVPVARTNVVVSGSGRSGDALHAFTYAVPDATAPQPADFLFSAIPEVRFTLTDGKFQQEVVREGESSPQAVQAKLDYILGVVEQRLESARRGWADVLQMHLYSSFDLSAAQQAQLSQRLGAAAVRGYQYTHSLPPIGPSQMEFDFRRVSAELTIPRSR